MQLEGRYSQQFKANVQLKNQTRTAKSAASTKHLVMIFAESCIPVVDVVQAQQELQAALLAEKVKCKATTSKLRGLLVLSSDSLLLLS